MVYWNGWIICERMPKVFISKGICWKGYTLTLYLKNLMKTLDEWLDTLFRKAFIGNISFKKKKRTEILCDAENISQVKQKWNHQ